MMLRSYVSENQPRRHSIWLKNNLMFGFSLAAMTLHVAFFAAIAFTDEPDSAMRKFSIPTSELQKLPLFATIDLTQFPRTFDVALPKSFVGYKLTGVVMLKNNGNADLVVNRIRTSCGCAVAQSEKRELAVADQTPLLVKFAFNQEGPFKNSVLISTTLGELVIRFTAEVVDQIVIDKTVHEVVEGSTTIPIDFGINDPSLLKGQLKFTATSGDLKLRDSHTPLSANRLQYYLSLPEDTLFPAFVTVTSASGNKIIRVFQLRIDSPGSINVSPRHAYAKSSADSEAFLFRLVLTGATTTLDAWGASGQGTIKLHDAETKRQILVKPCNYTCKKLKRSVILSVELQNDADLRALTLDRCLGKMTIAGVELEFDLTVR